VQPGGQLRRKLFRMKRQTNGHLRKWAWHRGALLSFRDHLLKQRTQRLSDASEPLELHSLDLADSATDEFDHNLALSRLSAEQDALSEVEEAIKRIANGSYGTCQESGEPIPEARLRAIPWTRFARDVAAQLEAKGAAHRMHLGALGSVRGAVANNLNETLLDGSREAPPANDESLHPVSALRSR
jgi:RNA polymerase-binding transcription factor DksA